MKNLHKMRLHETIRIDQRIKITRVPGGWIYNFIGIKTSTFVPFSHEFELVKSEVFPVVKTKETVNSGLTLIPVVKTKIKKAV